jgi:hypothetical protein
MWLTHDKVVQGKKKPLLQRYAMRVADVVVREYRLIETHIIDALLVYSVCYAFSLEKSSVIF